ncbi:hypothetical protein LWI29_002716 [Acer saccharum]|uniref:Uncharacterized protein n=1 Tax=Acer saccharum TaxID=4024 RepID=A0AA39W1T7_ACESA|nr:hypothetical protein LWI29_002716 [Acer saccharum]
MAQHVKKSFVNAPSRIANEFLGFLQVPAEEGAGGDGDDEIKGGSLMRGGEAEDRDGGLRYWCRLTCKTIHPVVRSSEEGDPASSSGEKSDLHNQSEEMDMEIQRGGVRSTPIKGDQHRSPPVAEEFHVDNDDLLRLEETFQLS